MLVFLVMERMVGWMPPRLGLLAWHCWLQSNNPNPVDFPYGSLGSRAVNSTSKVRGQGSRMSSSGV